VTVKDGGWEEQLRRGGLELAILLTLAPGTKYGLEIIRHLEETTDLVVAEGTVYPILSRLTREGCLTSAWTADEGPHPRKYYQLTDLGRRRLQYMSDHWREFTHKMDRLLEAAGGGTSK
jgi:PadR family transcriptional regulator PadR